MKFYAKMDSNLSSKLNIPDKSARNFSEPAASQACKLESPNVSQKHVSEAAASSKSLSSRAKRRLEVKLAEARRERIRRDEELRLKHLQFKLKLLSKRPILLPTLPQVAMICRCQRLLFPLCLHTTK